MNSVEKTARRFKLLLCTSRCRRSSLFAGMVEMDGEKLQRTYPIASDGSDSKVSVCGTADLDTQQQYFFASRPGGDDSLKDEPSSSRWHWIILTASLRTPAP